MGVKVPKEIQETDLLTLRLRAEGSALVHHPWGGGGWGVGGEGGRTCFEIQLNLSTTVTWRLDCIDLQPWSFPYGFYRKISGATLVNNFTPL